MTSLMWFSMTLCSSVLSLMEDTHDGSCECHTTEYRYHC